MGKKAFGVCKRITYLVMPAGGGVVVLHGQVPPGRV